MRNDLPISLQNPDELSLENAYRSLSRTGEITVETSLPKLSFQLEQLEHAGFAGMEIKAFASADEKITIRACKGKQGSCFNTGRTASYLGTALAALDDDHHLLLAGEALPICEKTATLFSFPAYNNHIKCSDADAGLTEKLQTDPELFDCDNFESSQERLYAQIQEKKPGAEFKDLFYPGPFKLLVLEDGTIIHRGRINKVPVEDAHKLIKGEALFSMDGQAGGPHESFTELYKAKGPRCLLSISHQKVITSPDLVPDFSALNTISRDLKNRLIDTIESKKDYFMLTGSNREDEYGCCPSDEVTMADHMARKGILSASRETATAEVCPLTIYAFRNEISSKDENLQFNQDQNFREEVLSRLKKNNPGLLKAITRWALFIFVALTLLLAIVRISGPSSPLQNNELYTRLEVSRPNSTVLVLFHYNKRCEQCLTMEKYSREVLKDDFSTMEQKKEIQFRQVVMDLPENRTLVDRYGLVTSTLVIIKFQNMEEDSIRVLDRSWALFNQEKEFKKMLSEELHQMTGQER
ncbi:MAG: hypothetical protein E4H10_12085 [Bacteroidia bacterium]|nr:MAG: hypothetical protein E4H10_12085 [Bacteroidia bacterium]